MRRAAVVIAALVILASPFGEGGRLPDSLAVLHAAALVLLVTAMARGLAAPAAGRPAGRGSGALLLPAAVLALMAVAAAGADYPYASMLALMDGLAAAGCAMAAAVLFGGAADLLALRALAVASTGLQASVSLAGLWRGGQEATTLFLNRNHLAAFLVLGLFLCVTAAESAWARGARRAAALWSGAATLHLLAILPLRSRGAALGILAAALVFLAIRWRAWPRIARVASVLGTTAVLAAALALVALRFAGGADPDRYTRLRIWEASWGMVLEHPGLGLGPGMFPHEAERHNFPLERGPVRFGRRFLGAHSAALTFAAENGLPAALLVAAAALSWILPLVRRGGTAAPDGAARGVGLALVALLTQALVEDLQERPAIVMTAALLAGSALATMRGWRPPAAASKSAPPAWRVRPRTAAALALLGLAVLAGGVVRPWLAWRCARSARALGRAGLPLMERAAALDPLNAEYHLDLAMATLNSGPPDPQRYAGAAIELESARRCHPRDARLALLRARLEARAGAGIVRDPTAGPRAAALYEEAARLAPTDPRPRLELAGHLADGGHLDDALAALDAALAIEPNYLRARLMEVTLLTRLGREDGLRQARSALLASEAALKGYAPDSAYAAEIVADDAVLRHVGEAGRETRHDAPSVVTTD